MAIFVPKGGISDLTPTPVESGTHHDISREAVCKKISIFPGKDLKDQYLNFDIQKFHGDAFPRTGRLGIRMFRLLFTIHPRKAYRFAMSLITYELLEEES